METDNNNFDMLEPVGESTIIRLEATFKPAPGFEYLNEVAASECVPVPAEPIVPLAKDQQKKPPL
jgi:hypothetical protein